MRTVKLLIYGLAALPALAFSANPNQVPVQLNGAGQPLNHTCTEVEALTLTGSGNHVQVFGPCESLAVQGSNNAVDIDHVNTITVSGDGNTVTWSTGGDKDGPKTQVSGKTNVVQKQQ